MPASRGRARVPILFLGAIALALAACGGAATPSIPPDVTGSISPAVTPTPRGPS
jgi:hypothetical protein